MLFSFQIFDKVAQAVIQEIHMNELVEVDRLNKGEHGVNGFGSTGV